MRASPSPSPRRPKTLGTVSPSAANITPRRGRSAAAKPEPLVLRDDAAKTEAEPRGDAADAALCSPARVPSTPGRERGDVASVRVLVRVRPMSQKERRRGEAQVLACPKGERSVSLGKRGFRYDNVLDGQSTQAEVFGELSDQVSGFLAGYNSTVLAYGQTGSGKTFTCGSSGFSVEPEDEGILPRLFTQIFDHVEQECIESTVTVSFVEIHLEACRDLLAQEAADQVSIQQNGHGEIEVSGVRAVAVVSRAQCLQVLAAGVRQRATAATGMNSHSSRSHAIVTVELQQLRRANPGENQGREIIRSKFNLVDLAGSERLKRTNAAGARLNEGININHGLLTLGKVITALVEREKAAAKGKSVGGMHVPYRESQLTRLLQDSLGGNTRTVMIACVSAAEIDTEATLSTLRYAAAARQIRNKPTKNVTVDDSAAQLRALQQQVAQLEAALAHARETAAPAVTNEGGGSSVEAALRERIVELQGTLEGERAVHGA